MQRTRLARSGAPVSSILGLVLAACSGGCGLKRRAGRRERRCQRRQRRQGHGQDRDQPVGRRGRERRGREVACSRQARLHGRSDRARRGDRLAGLRDRRDRRHPRELGPPGPREARTSPTRSVAQDAGLNGVTGIIGWYVPHWMVEEYPDITDWENLNKYADLFKTSESGDKGQFLGERPDVRHERRGAHRQPRPQLQGRLLRQRGREHHGLQDRRRSRRRRSSATSTTRSGCTARSSSTRSSCRRTRRAATPIPRRSPATTRRTPSTRSSRPRSPRTAAPRTSSSRTSPGPTRPERGRRLHHERGHDRRRGRRQVDRRQRGHLEGLDALTPRPQTARDRLLGGPGPCSSCPAADALHGAETGGCRQSPAGSIGAMTRNKLRLRHRRRRLGRAARSRNRLSARPVDARARARGRAPGLPVGRLHPHAGGADVPDRQPLLRLEVRVGAGAVHERSADLPRPRQGPGRLVAASTG